VKRAVHVAQVNADNMGKLSNEKRDLLEEMVYLDAKIESYHIRFEQKYQEFLKIGGNEKELKLYQIEI